MGLDTGKHTDQRGDAGDEKAPSNDVRRTTAQLPLLRQLPSSDAAQSVAPSGIDLAGSGGHSYARSSGLRLAVGRLATTSFASQPQMNNLYSFDT
jgi:hypothetical protein